MSSPNNWPQPDKDPELWMRHMEKRVLNEQRRPIVRKGSDLLGPGFAPFATQITDWSADETAFNGYFWSVGNATNAPANIGFTGVWMGWTVSNGSTGMETVWDLATMVRYERTWTLVTGVRSYTAWATEVGAWTAVTFLNSWVNYGSTYQVAQYRKVGDCVEIRGSVKNGTAGSVVFNLPAGFRPPADLYLPGNNNAGAGASPVYIQSDGDVIHTATATTTYYSLDGARFSTIA